MISKKFLIFDTKQKASIIFFLIFFLVFFILSSIKIYNLRSSYFDLGFYLNYYLNLVTGNYYVLFNSNYQLANLLLYPIMKILPFYYWSYFLIFFQSICLSLPIFFLKNRVNFICIYLLSAVLWFTALTEFHLDTIIIPIIFYLNKLLDGNKVDKKILLLFALILSIKIVYILLIIGYLIYFYYNKFKISKNCFYFFIFCVVYFIIFFNNINIPTRNAIKDLLSSIFTTNNILHFSSSQNILITIFVLLSSCSFLVFNNWKKIIIIFPLTFFYFILPSDSYKKYYYHYYAPIFPIFIIIFIDTFDYFVKKFSSIYTKSLLLIIPFISNIFFSPSPISYSFLFSYKWAFEYRAYLYDNSIVLSRVKLKELVINQSKNRKIGVMIENNLLFTELISNNITLKVFPDNAEFENYDFILLKSSSPHYILDNICEEKFTFKCLDYDFIKKYEEYLKKINLNFSQVYKDDNIIVFANKKLDKNIN
jgi:uncharacterized membrane protein